MDSAADAIYALVRGEDTDEAYVGAALIAEFLSIVRGLVGKK